ncbi:MAG: DUF4234 domain-containing protein [Myxococcota bacterium]
MTARSPVVVLLLGMFTLGIYPLIWLVSTKTEMNSVGAQIPTAWMLIIPILNLLWLWKWSSGVETATGGETGGALAFILIAFLGPIGMAVVQSGLNKRALPAAA